MILSINKLPVLLFTATVTAAITLLLCCFTSDKRMDATEAISYSHRILNQCYDAPADPKLKKWELNVTTDLFVRLRKTYIGGKQDYYSFRIKRFADLSYTGTAQTGTLSLNTDADNIIQQTYNDPKGNQDNMIQTLSLPVRNMEPERLDSLRTALLYLRNGK